MRLRHIPSWFVAGTALALGVVAATSQGGVVIVEGGPSTAGPRYVGDAQCIDCHSEIYAHWKQTAHAHAWETLAKTGDEAKAECVRCHSTGFGQPGGMDIRTLGPESRRDVQCESCHGPGEAHLREVATGASSTYACELCDAGRSCMTCHTPSQDPDFDLRSAWKRIAHPKVTDDGE